MNRYFSYENGVLTMTSVFEDEFGRILLDTIAPIDQDWISQRVRKDSASISIPMSSRIGEMSHFLKVFSLFDPEVYPEDGLSSFVSSAPSEPWETE